MTWVAWRLQRTESFIAAGILAAIALWLVPTGIEMAHSFHRDHVAACLTVQSFACANTVSEFHLRFGSLANITVLLTLVPGIIGVLLAAPFVLELESGTYRFAWTQGVSRRRWLAAKLGLAVLVACAIAVLLILLLRWWREPLVRMDGRMDPNAFDSQGVVAIGYALFALGLAAAIGAVWRRGVPALVVAFAGYFAARIFVDAWLRQRLIAPKSLSWKVGPGKPAVLDHAWVLQETGEKIVGCTRSAPLSQKCLVRPVDGTMHSVFEPASRFWHLQLLELGLFGGVALVLLALTAWWTLERTA